MKIRAIDIRYNLEYVGFKNGLGRYTEEDKIFHLEQYDKDDLKGSISGNGCPRNLEGTTQEFSSACGNYDGCRGCWQQEAKE